MSGPADVFIRFTKIRDGEARAEVLYGAQMIPADEAVFRVDDVLRFNVAVRSHKDVLVQVERAQEDGA